MAENKKKKLLEGLLDMLEGTHETLGFLPHAVGSVIAAAPEAAAAALDWSDRPEWLAPSMTPSTKNCSSSPKATTTT